jgi:serine-type D-Ala-D-Ala carboxypeptidase/endopeptidase (penicillin-binding protein 4)
VLPALAADAPAPAVDPLAAALTPTLRTRGLGPAVSATVVDPATGEIRFDRAGTAPRIPASVAKLVTATAVLEAPGPDARLATTVVAGAAPGELVLVGGGDPTLTALPQPRGSYPRWASLVDLAAATADRLAAGAATSVTVRVDDSRFAGPAVSPDWRPTYVPEGTVAPISALVVDRGRARPGTGDRTRVPDPALEAGRRFAALLRQHGVPVAAAVARGRAPLPAQATEAAPPPAPVPEPVPGEVLATTQSPPLDVLVEHMLRTSDNVVAEGLARLAAAEQGHPASFAGVRAALTAALTAGGPVPPAAGILDGSGLARGSAISSRVVARLLARAAGDDPPGPRLRALFSGLPVAGFDGTLADRFDSGPAADAAGTVRAKTGTLNGVSSLAGQVVDADGRLLVFAVLADRVANTVEARAAQDAFAAALASCGCR